MPVYMLSNEGEAQAKQRKIRVIPLIALASLPALLLVYSATKGSPLIFAIVLLVMVAVTSITLAIAIRMPSSVKFTTDGDRLTLERRSGDSVTIARSEVTEILEDMENGLTVKTADPTVRIFVSKDVRHYDQLKAELNSWSPIQLDSDHKMPMALTIAGLVLMVLLSIGAFVLKIRECFYGLVVVFGCFLVYRYVQSFRSMLATKNKSKRVQLIFSFAILAYVVYKIVLEPLMN